jgi:hypothetical protein
MIVCQTFLGFAVLQNKWIEEGRNVLLLLLRSDLIMNGEVF